jgi:hypothetical protein
MSYNRGDTRQRARQRVRERETIELLRWQLNGGRTVRLFLALQLPFLATSESMGNHDSKIVDADSVC